jgi:hypothetical protein
MQGKTPDPPFWIRETDDLGRPVDPGVLASARRIWKRIFCMVESRLKDGARAPEILEAAALAVSNRLRQEDADPIRDLDAYLFWACAHRIDKIAADLAREQTGHDLEQLARLAATTADGWENRFFGEILVGELLSYMDARTRRFFSYRGLGWSWKETAAFMGYADAHSAEVQYWKGLKAARERLESGKPPEPEAG